MYPVLNLGGAALQLRGLLLLLGFWAALAVAEHFARRRGIDGDIVWNAGLLGLGGAIVGARLAYVAQNLALYRDAPLAVLSLSLQSLAWTEGLLVGALIAYIYLQRTALPLADLLDAAAPGVALFAAAAAVGALLSGDAYGTRSTLPWAIFLWNDLRHPVQGYEALAALGALGLLAWWWPRAPYPGWVALVGTALLAAGRLVIERFRADPATVAGGVRVAQLWALALLLVALWALSRCAAQAAAVPPTAEPPGALPTDG